MRVRSPVVPPRIGVGRLVTERRKLSGVIVFEGDSITAGFDNSNGLFDIVSPPTSFGIANPTATVYNVAAGGDTVQNMVGEAATEVDPKFDSSKPWNVANLWAGINDLRGGRTPSQVYADANTWCTARRAAGFKVIICNVIYFGDDSSGRPAYNAMLASDNSFADAYVDLAVLLVDRVTYPQYWQTDDIHITAAGGVVVASAIETALRRIV